MKLYVRRVLLMKKHLEIIPGFLLALFVAFCAKIAELEKKVK